MSPRRLLLVIVAVSLPALAAPAWAHHNGEPTIDHYVHADGHGQLIANPGGHPVTWAACAPGAAACEPIAGPAGTANVLDVSDAPAGTTFEATQDGTAVRSEPWRGLVTPTSPPRVEGDVRVGGTVRYVAGGWAGGWGRERDWL